MSSLVPGAESKLRCMTMPTVHVPCSSATTWRMWLDSNDSKVCLEVQIDEPMVVGQRVRYTMDCTIHAHVPSPEEVRAAARV